MATDAVKTEEENRLKAECTKFADNAEYFDDAYRATFSDQWIEARKRVCSARFEAAARKRYKKVVNRLAWGGFFLAIVLAYVITLTTEDAGTQLEWMMGGPVVMIALSMMATMDSNVALKSQWMVSSLSAAVGVAIVLLFAIHEQTRTHQTLTAVALASLLILPLTTHD